MRNIRGIFTGVAVIALALAVTQFPISARATGKTSPNFSGSYTLTKTEGYPLAPGHVYTMTVVETDSSIQVTRGGTQKMSTVYPLKGHDKCATMIAAFLPGAAVFGNGHPLMKFPGASAVQPIGTCTAKSKGQKLTLQSFASVPMNGSNVRVMYTEQWQLSPDSRTIRIQYDLAFTDQSNPVRNFVAYYTRN
jgi:hypothetical protein